MIIPPPPAYSEWTKVSKGFFGEVFVDFKRIKKKNGFVDYWVLQNYRYRIPWIPWIGIRSLMTYCRGDCELFRFMIMSDTFYKGQMGNGHVVKVGGILGSISPTGWGYPRPDSADETMLKSVCDFASHAYSEWTKVGERTSGAEVFVDFKRISKKNGFVYFWVLVNHPKPVWAEKYMSVKSYNHGDCGSFKFMTMSYTRYTGQMGNGDVVEGIGGSISSPEWGYPRPDSSGEIVLKLVCYLAQ